MNWRSVRSLGGFLLAVALIPFAALPVPAQTFSSGSTGADGPFNPTSNTTLPLPPNGVFHFTTITIPSGVTVTFTRNAANTPVVLLATGNVTLNGTLDVSAGNASQYGRPGSGGPGGFDGGAGADGITTGTGGFGLGPGGGGGGTGIGSVGGGGGYGTGGSGASGSAGPTYGNVALRPIVGGSGGGGGGGEVGVRVGGGGGGGGGALVIASSTSIALNTAGVAIRANGSSGSSGIGGGGSGGDGSGGAIRLIAPTLTGTSRLEAQAPSSPVAGRGYGRIRLEATTLTFSGTTSPLAATGFPVAVFPGTGQPSLTIASVGGIPAPATPSGNVLAAPDILLPVGTTNPVEVALSASNIPLGTTIQVTATPQTGSRSTAVSTGLAGTLASSTATASLTLSLTQTSVLTASATFPLVASSGSGPLYVEGEEVTHIRVAAVFGGHTQVSYLTKSGREIALP